MNVLLIEDDAIDAEMVARLLGKSRPDEKSAAKSDIIHVSYFQQGLEVLAENKNIDIVILDLHLPDGEGSELVKQLNDQYSDVPIVVMTGLDADEGVGVELVRQGAEDYVSKNSVNENSLKRSIRYAIERRSLVNQIKQQSEILKEHNRELESFAYIASHDLRAPLINIKGFSSELQYAVDTLSPLLARISPTLEAEDRKVITELLHGNIPQALNFIQGSAEKMGRLIAAILQYSRLGKRKLVYESIDMNQLVRQCIDIMEHRIKQGGVSVSVGDLPPITADRLSIEQVFSNLLDNALKYLDPARPGKIEIRSSRDKLQTVFSVADNGVGIAADDMHKVFEIFRRAGAAAEIPGEGIGMPNARAIIKRHDGNIWFESVLGKGSTFYFSIPFNLPENKDVTREE